MVPLVQGCCWYLSLFGNAVEVTILSKGGSVTWETERYFSHKQTVPDQIPVTGAVGGPGWCVDVLGDGRKHILCLTVGCIRQPSAEIVQVCQTSSAPGKWLCTSNLKIINVYCHGSARGWL